jgi:hypothetical protein
VTTYFRLHPEDEDPQELLEPENQVSKPWGGCDPGPCDKCGATGHLDGFDECPTCTGTGRITDGEPRRRRGSAARRPERIVMAGPLGRERIDQLKPAA